jgi:site-specific DNA-methyltransferase (adenine-specific)
MVLSDPPYEKTRCKWDKLIPLDKLWPELERVTKDNAAIVMTAVQPFASKLVMSNSRLFKYDWVWEKTQATGFFNAKKQPLRAHEYILVFYKKLPIYNPQKTFGHKPVSYYTKYLHTVNKTEVYGKSTKELSGGGDTDRYPRTVQVFSSDKQTSYLHPTQKPLALFEYLIKTYTKEGDLVLDFAAGSGTTGVACRNLSRNFILIEKEEEYCDIAEKRIPALEVQGE